MRKPASVDALNNLGRVRLSRSFFMRDFLFSEIAAIHGIANIPDDPDLAIAAGTQLCEHLLEPLQDAFGRIAIRGAYRSVSYTHLDVYKRQPQRRRLQSGRLWLYHLHRQFGPAGCADLRRDQRQRHRRRLGAVG